jgi:hypothetical protein
VNFWVQGEEAEWMKKKLRKKPYKKGLKADDTVANIREEENTNPKTPHNTAHFMPAGE